MKSEADLEEIGSVAHFTGEMPRRDAPRWRAQVDIGFGAIRHSRKHVSGSAGRTVQDKSGIGDVPAGPVPVRGARSHLGEERRRLDVRRVRQGRPGCGRRDASRPVRSRHRDVDRTVVFLTTPHLW